MKSWKLTLVFSFLIMSLWASGNNRDIYGYSVLSSNQPNGPTYEWITPDETNEILNLGDDAHSDLIPIGFSFPFYMGSYEELYVCSNGFLSFGESSSTLSNQTIPNGNAPNNIIAWFWDDLNPTYDWANSHIYYETTTVDNQTAFVISFMDYAEFGGTAVPDNCIQAQVILFESGDIKINYDYLGVELDQTSNTIGIENNDGTDGILYEYNDEEGLVPLEDDMSLLFSYPAFPDNDILALNITGPTMATATVPSLYSVTLFNRGNAQDSYDVQVINESEVVLASTSVNTTIGNFEQVTIDLNVTFPTEGDIQIRGKVALAGDENPENDITDPIEVTVNPSDNITHQIGEGTALDTEYPWNAYWWNSLTQTIYYAEEFNGLSGDITAISYFYNYSDTLNERSFEMWIAEVDTESLENDWIDYDEFTPVFNDLVSFEQGEGSLTIPFDNAFTYSGEGNLCVMVRRGDREYHSSSDRFYFEETEAYPNRSIEYHADGEDNFPDVENPPAVNGTDARVPNTLFSFSGTGAEVGQVSGVVLDANGPVAGAEVALTEANRVVTDNDGNFYFSFVSAGDYDLTVSKFGYYDEVVEDVTVTAGDTTTQDITITGLPMVTVTGRVVGSDDTDSGLANAAITLAGYATYSTITDADGLFNISDVYAAQNYDMEVNVDNYSTYTGVATVGDTDTDLGDIVVDEIAYPASEAVAEQNDEDTEVTISWAAPNAVVFASREMKKQYPASFILNNNRAIEMHETEFVSSRSLIGYQVYSLLNGNEDMQSTWTQITDTPVTENTFLYTDWVNITEGFYRFAVKAVYSNDVLSEPVFTNWVGRDKYTSATITVSMADATSPEGATVNLVGTTPDPDGTTYNYSGTAGTDGVVALPMVWKGMYNIVVSKENYGSSIQEDVEIVTPTELDVTLAEVMNPVAGLNAVVDGDDVTLTWMVPGTSTGYDFEANNGGFISNSEDGWQHGIPGQGYVAHSGSNVWGTVLDTTYISSADWTLDTPAMSISGGSVLAFWHFHDIESSYDGGNVKISIDGGNNWELLTPVGDYPDDMTTGLGEPAFTGTVEEWYESVFDLADYAGQSAMFRFHFGTDSSVVRPGWFIDDVEIRPARFVQANEVVTDRRENGSRRINVASRALESYKVMRGTDVLATATTDTTYTDENLANGTYEYSVIATYTYGDSSPAMIEVSVFPITISGTIEASDNPGNGLANATVHIQNNLVDLQAVTDADGQFSFAGQGNMSYSVEVTHSAYVTHTEEIEVGSSDYTLDITMNEQTYAPTNVVATPNGASTEVTITWSAPTRTSSLLRAKKEVRTRSVTGYVVYRLQVGNEQNEGTWVYIANTEETTATEEIPTGLPAGNYKYAVKTVYTGDLLSDAGLSNEIELTEPLNAPTDLSIQAQGASVLFSWSAPSRPLLGYEVFLDGYSFGIEGGTYYIFDGATLNMQDGQSYTAGVVAKYSGDMASPMATIDFVYTATEVPVITETKLVSNYPNPFNPTTTIKWQQKKEERINIDIYNILGQKVKTLVNEAYSAGHHSIEWVGDADNGSNVASGVYFIRMNTTEQASTLKVLLMK